MSNAEFADRPEDLGTYFVDRLNNGDLEGLVALYEPDATIIIGTERRITGRVAIREAMRKLLARRPIFVARQQEAIRHGRLALTSARLVDGRATFEVARCQPDGTWLWLINCPPIPCPS
ncbi:YybH family protein [Nocardia sp. CDC160]|uniref:YybH family protein n=1 Tax=Nocardia sp. CDC160 TaxID=3112166 RepID=UPI002DB62129|nr:nuclear transport factor 2 family protein [Nocardia sp. CDC160]MEC3920363.1 nuclear transport factor 2 family protein [Nocardia sp. CDC160]